VRSCVLALLCISAWAQGPGDMFPKVHQQSLVVAQQANAQQTALSQLRDHSQSTKTWFKVPAFANEAAMVALSYGYLTQAMYERLVMDYFQPKAWHSFMTPLRSKQRHIVVANQAVVKALASDVPTVRLVANTYQVTLPMTQFYYKKDILTVRRHFLIHMSLVPIGTQLRVSQFSIQEVGKPKIS